MAPWLCPACETSNDEFQSLCEVCDRRRPPAWVPLQGPRDDRRSPRNLTGFLSLMILALAILLLWVGWSFHSTAEEFRSYRRQQRLRVAELTANLEGSREENRTLTEQAGNLKAELARNGDLVLALSSTTEGRLRRGDRIRDRKFYDEYRLPLENPGTIVLDLTSSDFDPYLTLIDPAGQVVDKNDDFGSISRSLVVSRVTNTGTWRIRVTSFSAQETGTYSFKVYWAGQ